MLFNQLKTIVSVSEILATDLQNKKLIALNNIKHLNFFFSHTSDNRYKSSQVSLYMTLFQ